MFKQNLKSALSALNLKQEHLKPSGVEDEALESLAKELENGLYPAFSIANTEDDLPELEQLSKTLQKNFKHIVCLGVGGSSLGAQVLARFAGLHQKPQLHFIDNVSASTIENLLESIPLADTALLAVSKSGGTIDTMLQALILVDAFEKENLPLNEHIMVVTEPKESPLEKLATKYNLQTLEHDPNIGGRYSILSVVGVLPALIAGTDVKAIRQGAANVLNDFCTNPLEAAATKWSLLALQAEKKGYGTNILMPYGDSWRLLGPWFVQLWAESLGKKGLGTMPVAGVGSTDQHSMLQLLLDGPGKKLVTLIVAPGEEIGPKVRPDLAEFVGQNHLADLRPGALLKAQGQGTAEALAARGCPVRLIEPESMNAESLGQLIMTFMLETVITARLIGVNPFDQPAVEEGKKRAMAYLQG